jgi:SAM-dependent methyltransferase
MINRGVGDQAYFDRWYASRSWEFYSPILSQIVAYSMPGPILDVGAGAGFLVECAAQWGLDCKGIEGSPAAIQIAGVRCPSLQLTQVFLSDPFPFETGSFQTVIMNQVIEHLEKDVAHSALCESFRVLRNRGAILVFSPSRFNTYEARADPTHINMLSPAELRAALCKAGFRQIVAMDAPLWLLGDHRIGRALMWRIFRATGWERLSATANCRAYRLNAC